MPDPSKADLYVRKLTLRLEGLSPEQGQMLARQVAEGLAAADLRTLTPRRIGLLHRSIQGSAGDGVPKLAETIVADLVRTLERTV